MAITLMTDADYDPVFKRNYLKLADNLYSTYDNWYSQVKKTFGTLGGKLSEHPVETTFGGGVGGSSDGTLPVANHTSYINAQYTAKRQYARVNIDGLTIESSDKTEWSFVKAIDQETTGKLRSFNRNIARVWCNDGSGILGQFTGPAGGTAAAPTMTILTTGNYGRRHACFEKGDGVQINSLNSLFVIASYVRSTGVLTLTRKTGSDDLTGLAVATHSIYMQGSKDTEAYGILGVYLNSTHYGAAEEFRWAPNRVNASSAPLDTTMLTELVETSEEMNDESFTHIWMPPYQYRKYIQLLEDQKRFPVPTEVKAKPNKMTSPDLIARVSYGGIQYVGSSGNITVMKNKFLRNDMIVGFNANYAEAMHVKKPGWAQRDGTVFMRMEDRDAYEARYVCYHENKLNPFYLGFIYGLDTTGA